MKKFKFFALAFAALSFAACSDDVIDGKGGNTGAAGDGTPAYLTISFSANGGNSSRSTADDANNNGDDHSTETPGTGEDSGHHNNGTADERAVDKVLVVIVPSDGGNVNFAKMYSTTVSGTSTEDEDEFKIVDQPSGSYVNDSPIELATGKYNVIVVANPVVDLITGISGGDLNAGIENSNVVEDLYTKITTGNYNPTEADYANIAAGNPLTTGTNFRVMMANKGLSTSGQAYTVELTEANVSPNEPAVADIEVERVLSKVTFRETNSNIYEIHPKVGAVRAEKVEGAIQKDGTWIKTTLNVAADALGNEVYVWVQENEDTGERTYTVYKEDGTTTEVAGEPELTKYTLLTAKDKDEFTAGDKNTCYAVADVNNPMASITYKPDDTITPEQTWYVRLEGYALVNLSKNVHYVRHTVSTAGGETPFGVLNGSNYLYTPYWGEKNGINFVEDAKGDLQFPAGFDPTTTTDVWFYNTLAKVSAESENMTINAAGEFKLGETTDDAIYYKPMSSLGSDEDGTVTGDDHYETAPTKPGVGKFMAYCFENSTDLDHQTHGLSTGISFVARMYKKNDKGSLSEPVTRLYRYGNNNLFESLAAIQQAFGASFMSEKFNELVEQEANNPTSITDEVLKGLATAENGGEHIELYNDNICYYYTTEIKHFDNGDNAHMGNMEFAIMRNNIYSLAVTSINMVGDPAVVPTPGTPDENPTPNDARLNVEVQILPWIVRYNDIEF